MSYIDIVFDGPPGHDGGRFVEVESDKGHSINVGEWIERSDGYWALRITDGKAERPPASAESEARSEHLTIQGRAFSQGGR